MGYMEPPRLYQPVRQCLGAVLLRLGRAAEAELVWHTQISACLNAWTDCMCTSWCGSAWVLCCWLFSCWLFSRAVEADPAARLQGDSHHD